MANQDTVLYSGSESSSPSLIFPNRLAAMATQKTTKKNTVSRYSHPKSVVRNVNNFPEKAANPSLKMIAVPATMADRTIDAMNTVLLFSFFIPLPSYTWKTVGSSISVARASSATFVLW